MGIEGDGMWLEKDVWCNYGYVICLRIRCERGEFKDDLEEGVGS